MNGVLVVSKPEGITSRKVVDRVERWFPRVKVGHAGTLDPLATGVLVLCLGSATRLIEYVQRMRKTYTVAVRLGATSDTDDADGTVQPVADAEIPNRSQLEAALAEFTGEIDQVPPAYSAAHVEGRRAYRLARAGREVSLSPRRVGVYHIGALRYEYPTLELVVECGKGTYIRSLARDLGRRLGCGGYVEQLGRTRIGPFRVERAVLYDSDAEVVRARVLPIRSALAELAHVMLSGEQLRRLRQGQRLPFAQPVAQNVAQNVAQPAGEPSELAVLDQTGEAAGVAAFDLRERVLKPIKML